MIVFEPASPRKRVLAALVDLLLAGAGVLVAWSGAVGQHDWRLLGAAVVLLVLVYQSLLLLNVEQTAGMRLFGLFVDPVGAVRLDRLTVAVRLWVPVALAAGALLWDVRRGGTLVGGAVVVDLLWLALPGRRCLHDLVAGTQVLDGRGARRLVDHATVVLRALWLSAIFIVVLFFAVMLVALAGALEMFLRWFGHMG